MEDRLSAYLQLLDAATNQAANRWDLFEVSAPEQYGQALRFQLAFAGLALAAIASHPHSFDFTRERCRTSLAALTERMLQRRTWAYWSTPRALRNHSPDPLDEGNLEFVGHAALLMSLYRAIGGDQRFESDQVLVWSSDWRFVTTHESIIDSLSRQMRSAPSGGVPCSGEEVHTVCMAAAIWALRLHHQVYQSEYVDSTYAWLRFAQANLPLSGPWLLNRGAWRMSHNSRGRKLGGSDPIHDAWATALLTPLLPQLSAAAGERLIPQWQRLIAKGKPEHGLQAAFAYLAATELQHHELATRLRDWIDQNLAPEERDGWRKYRHGGMAVTSIVACADAGGVARLLSPAAAPVSDDLEVTP